MKGNTLWLIGAICGLACVSALAAPEPDHYAAFEAARKLEQEGAEKAAFLRFLVIPGGESAAVSLARGAAREYLATLRDNPGALASPRARLVEADLLLMTGQRDEARKRYQTLAALARTNAWGTGQPGYYPVEPPSYGERQVLQSFGGGHLAEPFRFGPGSHRDNWLLRRLLALDLTNAAAGEFARIWEVHRRNTQPYLELTPRFDEKGQNAGEDRRLVRPSGFDSYGLQFALDYAYFLKRDGNTNQALAVLREPLRVMDLDRNPNLQHSEPVPASTNGLSIRSGSARGHGFGFGAGAAGVSRKEFVRLVYGEFKSVGQERGLLGELQQRLDAGDNRARRLLAQMRLHQGQPDAALALELEYIARGDFDELTSAYRRGLIDEEFKRLPEAAVEFEKVLALKPAPMRLPDAEEQISEATQLSARAFIPAWGESFAPMPDIEQVQARLVRLYSALGRTDKAMEVELAQFETNERWLDSLEALEQMAQRFKGAGQEARFNEWAKRKSASAKTPLARANLAWQQRDYPAALTNAAAASASGYYGWQDWREKFARLGREPEREFMRAVVKAHPRDAVARLTLLDLEDRLEGVEAIAALEALLATDANEAFPRGKGVSNRTHFRNYLDLAYRLMRLYEQNAQLEKLRALGLRIARDEKPFDAYDPNLYWSLGENSVEDLGNACLALAIQYAEDTFYQEQLRAALKSSRWVGPRAQLERRAGRHPSPTPHGEPAMPGTDGRPVLRWANVPENVQIFAAHGAVTCWARDERFVYAGTTWGLTVYDFQGGPVARVALGSPVQTMVVTQQQIWVGTSTGLFRIERGAASPTNATTASSWPIAQLSIGSVSALALDGELLWLGVPGGIRTLNRRTLELRSFSLEELNLPLVREFTRIVPETDFVWVDGDCGLLRYDRAADAWAAPPSPGPRGPPHLIGIIDGQPWVDVYLDDELEHRPARMDRRTLNLTPLLLGGNLSREQRRINDRLVYLGKDLGRLVFQSGGRWFVVDAASGQLRALKEDDGSGTRRITNPLPDDFAPSGWDATRAGRSWPDGLRVGYRASAWPDQWPAGAVWAVVFDDARRQDWLCTGAGLAVLKRGQPQLEHFGSTEGLIAGPMMDGVELGGKLYFATGWEDARGALTVYDPQTAVFSAFFRSDGMDSEKVLGVGARDGQLELRFGIEYRRYDEFGDRRYRQCQPARFAPATRRFTSTGPPEMLTQQEADARARRENLGSLPFLGGKMLRRYEHEGRTWLCGEQGLVVLLGQESVSPAFEPLAVRSIPSSTELLRQEAARVTIPNPVSLETLRTLLSSSNRYVRANALATPMSPVRGSMDDYAPVIATCVEDPYFNARATAVWLLARLPGEASVPFLRTALRDSDASIRIVAALALANRGQRPPLACFEEVLAGRQFGNYPFGVSSTVGVEADRLRVFQALAPGADRVTFEFLLKYPLEPSGYDAYPRVLDSLGEALRKHPDAAEPLLHAHDPQRDSRGQVQFAQAVFQHAGKELLPVLHRALSSPDRVVRSNAARACGAIGDPSSLAPLLAALELESGLSRASIVWALGELKAAAAIPKLVELYTDARNAEHNRRAGAGFLAQQAAAADRAQYTALRNLDAIAADWDELQTAARRPPADPRRDEELLTAALVLDAVRKLGPAAQPFYRALAGASETSDRAQAAVYLAAATGLDRNPSLAILNNLCADPDLTVRVPALVSLLILGQSGLEATLRDRLLSADESEQALILDQLARLSGPQLLFARKEIAALAANERQPRFLRERAALLVAKLPPGN